MKFNKKLVESKETDPEIAEFMKRAESIGHPFVKQWAKNFPKALAEGEIEIGALRGQTVGDAVSAGAQMQVYATLEIFNAVIRGYTRYMDDSFVRKYVTESVVFKIPKVEYQELVGAISAGQLPHVEKMIDYATVDLSNPESEKGGKVAWTRSLLEDVTFDVQAEMAEGLGHAIAVCIMTDILAALQAISVYGMPKGDKITISNPITWADFLAVVGAVDTGYHVEKLTFTSMTACVPSDIGKPVTNEGGTPIGVLLSYDALHVWISTNAAAAFGTGSSHTFAVSGGTGTGDPSANEFVGFRTYGPADYCLVSPDIYWQLLNIIQATNVLYEGSTDPVNKGIIKLALGCTIAKQGLLPANTIIAVNSEKSVAIVTRRTLKIEPVLFPVWNEYGFIGTVRYGVTALFPGATQIGGL
jgi:hypothetical protein